MGTGIGFEDLEAAMNAEFKKSTGIQEFVTKVITLVEQIAGVTLTVTIGE